MCRLQYSRSEIKLYLISILLIEYVYAQGYLFTTCLLQYMSFSKNHNRNTIYIGAAYK
jgi:hypothetical protein